MSKLGKATKWIIGVVSGLLILVVAAAILVPILFKDDLLRMGKDYANEYIDATLDFNEESVQLSLLWSFPDVSFSIEDLSVTGKGAFEGKKLADIGHFYFTVNILDIINQNYTVNGIELADADFYVKVLRDGTANYDIMISDGTTADVAEESKPTQNASELSLSIDHWALTNINLIYDDEPAQLYVELKDLDHEGSGDFASTLVDFETQTSIEALTASSGGIRYLRKANLTLDFNAGLDLAKKVYELRDNRLRINALELVADGSISQPNKDDLVLDLTFEALRTSFGSVLSLIPAAYIKDFDDVKTKGNVQLNGFAKGTYNKNTYPAFALNLSVDNGEVQYPDLPLPIREVNANIKVNSPKSDLNAMTLDVTKFHFEVGSNPVDATLRLRTPMSDPDVKATVDGTVVLDEFSKAFPMEGVAALTGTIKANLDVDTRMSYVTEEKYDKVKMKGGLAINQVKYSASNLPLVKIKEIVMEFTSNAVNLDNFDLTIGRSDLKGSGQLDNLLTYFSRDNIMKGNLKLRSKYFNANEILKAQSSASTEETPAAPDKNVATRMQDTTVAETPIFDAFNFSIDAEMAAVQYDVYNILNLKTKGSFSPSLAKLENLSFDIGEVDIQAKGIMENVFGYLFHDELLEGTVTFYSEYMNLNQFMTKDGTAEEPEATIKEVPDDVTKVESEMKPILVPDNLDLTLLATMKRLLYDNYDLHNVQAEIHVKDQILDIVALRADAFGGDIFVNGAYNTQNPKDPKFAFAYKVDRLSIPTVFNQVGVAQRFAPFLKSVTGTLSSDFEIKGDLQDNLYPDLGSLAAVGVLETFDTEIKDNETLTRLGNQLNIAALKEVNLANTINRFKIKDGKLKIEPGAYHIAGMDIVAGGEHGLDNQMDYEVKLRVPRSLLGGNAVGAAANRAIDKGLATLAPQAKQLGVNLEQSQFINLKVDVLGAMSKPQFKVHLLGGETSDGKNLGEQVTASIKEEAEKAKAELEAKAKAEKERIQREAQAKIDAEKERLRKEAEERARMLAQQAAKDPQAALDSLKNTDIQGILNGDNGILKDPAGQLGDIFKNDKDKDQKDKNKKTNPFGNFKNPFEKK